ncbi:hypothetical protein CL673_06705 [Candidatus Bathyarchaeota archaeon]|nr:hypothetical protein [Candidatus Bathyarchaeota archaeon]
MNNIINLNSVMETALREYSRRSWAGGLLALLLALVLIFLSLDLLGAGLTAAREVNRSNGTNSLGGALAGEVIVTVSLAQTEPFLVSPIPGLLVSIVDPNKRNATNSGLVLAASTNTNGVSAFIIPEGTYEVKLQYSGLESNITINSGREQSRVHIDWTFIRQPLDKYLIEFHDNYRDNLLTPGDVIGISFPSTRVHGARFFEVYFSGPGGFNVESSLVGRSVVISPAIRQSQVAIFQVIESSISGQQEWAFASPLSRLHVDDLLQDENPIVAAYWLLTQVARIP